MKRNKSEFKNTEFHDFIVSNETIPATKQEFFFTKLAPVQNITDIVLLGFPLILLPECLFRTTLLFIFL